MRMLVVQIATRRPKCSRFIIGPHANSSLLQGHHLLFGDILHKPFDLLKSSKFWENFILLLHLSEYVL